MNTTTIFNFDHGQKKMHNAIGVSEEFFDSVQDQIATILKNYVFDDDKNIKIESCPSQLVEAALHEFSYNQLVLIAGLYLQDKLEHFAESMERKVKEVVKKISLHSDDIPSNIRDFFEKIAEESGSTGIINGDDLPEDIRNFLDGLAKKSEEDNDD
jgi:hypothetical protein